MDWIEEARVIAAQCWCDDRAASIEMDVVLAEIIAERIAAWMDTAAQNQKNADYYRMLLEDCGESIGEQAYICDDGTRSESVLCAKIPDIIADAYANVEPPKP